MNYWNWIFHRQSREKDLDDEVQTHLRMAAQERIADGEPVEQAHASAAREFGNDVLVKEVTRQMWGLIWLETLLQDLRYGLRQLLRNPGFTLVAVLTLALGIGANSAVFNVLDAVLLRPLPVVSPQELVLLTDPDSHGRSYGDESGNRSLLTYTEFEYFRDHNDAFSGIFAADSQLSRVGVSLGNSTPGASAAEETARVRLVSGGYFSTLGVEAAAGRLFTAEVDRARNASPVVVISYDFWRDRLGQDPAILGRTIRIRQTRFEIIGIAARGFKGETVGQFCDLWIPITMQDAVYPGYDLLARSQGLTNQYIWLQAMGRLKKGVMLKQANAAINVSFKQFLESSLGAAGTPEQRRHYFDQQINIQSGARGISALHHTFGTPLVLLMAMVVLVLLIACANVANLQLARGTARRREFAVRIAIGAGRFRLLRQLLVESLLLTFVGAAVSVLMAEWADALLIRMVSAASQESGGIQLKLVPDARALGFTMAVAVVTAILFGLVPALHATRQEVSPALKSPAGWAGATARRLPAGQLMVIAQVAVSLVLLVGAGLFVHSLAKLSEVNLGYNRDHLLLFKVDAANAGLKDAANLQFHHELLNKFLAVPGVRAATLSSNGLFQDRDSGDTIKVEGYTPKPGEEMHSRMDHIGPGFFGTLGIPLLIGREIGLQDIEGAPRVAVVNESFAKRFFPRQNPLGKHVRDTFPGNPGDAEIVGVVADSKANSLRDQNRERIYFPYFNPMWEHTFASYEIRTFGDAASVSRALRKVVEDASPNLPRITIETMSGLVDQSLGTDRFIMHLSGAFGILALLLAGIGLYGVMAYNVARRTHDIGVRMALGARPARILSDVLRETLFLVVVGVLAGIAAALAGVRLIKDMLFGIGSVDTPVLALAITTLATVALLAGFLPARRAAHVDPMVALRHE